MAVPITIIALIEKEFGENGNGTIHEIFKTECKKLIKLIKTHLRLNIPKLRCMAFEAI